MDSLSLSDSLLVVLTTTQHQTNLELRTLAVLALFAIGVATGVAFLQGLESRT